MRMCVGSSLRSNVDSDLKSVRDFLRVCSCNFFQTKLIAMNVVNEEILESHEGKRQLLFQKQRVRSRERPACGTKEQRL